MILILFFIALSMNAVCSQTQLPRDSTHTPQPNVMTRMYQMVDSTRYISDKIIVTHNDTSRGMVRYQVDSVVSITDTFNKFIVKEVVTYQELSYGFIADTVRHKQLLGSVGLYTTKHHYIVDTVYFLRESTAINPGNEEVLIYGNPTKNYAYIACDQDGEWHGTLYTKYGKTIALKFSFPGRTTYQVDMSLLAKGTYILRIENDSYSLAKEYRLIKLNAD